MATGHQTVPKAPDKVYPCIPDHTGGHGGDYGDWATWWQWLKQKYGDKWANEIKAKYGPLLEKYLADKYSGKTTTTTFGGGGGHGPKPPDDCDPECPDGKASSKTMTTSTYGGGNHGGDDECCPPDSKASSYTTSTYGGNHGGGWGGHDDDCDPPKPGCGPDKTGGYAGKSGYHSGQPPKDDDRGDCPNTDCKASGGNKTYGGGSSSHSHNKCDPPTVNTGGCSGCKPASMTITGTVDPMGNETYYKFEYGTTPAFGYETDWESAGSGTDPKSVSTKIDGLAPGTKIYYRLIAKNKRGTTNGSTRYCSTTPSSKPEAVTTGANDVKYNSATINGTVDPNGASTTAYFQYGKTTSLGSQTGGQNVGSGDDDKGVSSGLSGLQPNTTYYYRVVATNSKGTAYGDIKSFKTPANKPVCYTGGYGSISKSGAKVNGTVNPGGGSTNYYFEYGKTSSLGSKTGNVSAGSGSSDAAASSSLSGLASNTKYYYRVVAVNSEGTTYGAVQNFTTSR